MKTIFTLVGLVLLSFGNTYLLGAYFTLEPNPFEWTKDGRVLHVCTSIIVLFALTMWRLLYKDNK